jgi:hypothetical protein
MGTIYVRDAPEKLKDVLKKRAKANGMSLSRYSLAILSGKIEAPKR